MNRFRHFPTVVLVVQYRRHHRVGGRVGARERQASPKRQEAIHVPRRQAHQLGALTSVITTADLGRPSFALPHQITQRIFLLANPFPGD